MPRRASISARSCGVETITAPASGTAWAMVSCASPVPGGMSTTSTSSVAPLHLAQHLLQRRHHHRPAPDHRRLLLDQEADRHHLQPVGRQRPHDLALEDLRLVVEIEELRHRRAIDVGVEHADLQAQRGEAEREVGRRRRLADAALAGRHRDDVAARRARRPSPSRPAARGPGDGRTRGEPGCGRASRRAVRRQRRQHAGDARQLAHRVLRGLPHRLGCAGLRGIGRDREIDLAVLDRDARRARPIAAAACARRGRVRRRGQRGHPFRWPRRCLQVRRRGVRARMDAISLPAFVCGLYGVVRSM